jgi:hypothetical protein
MRAAKACAWERDRTDDPPAALQRGPLAGRRIDVDVVERRPSKTIDATADDRSRYRSYCLADWAQTVNRGSESRPRPHCRFRRSGAKSLAVRQQTLLGRTAARSKYGLADRRDQRAWSSWCGGCQAKSDNYRACLTASDARHKPAR